MNEAADTEKREHAPLTGDEAEVPHRREGVSKGVAQVQDALAHAVKLLLPLRSQAVIAEDGLHNRGTMGGRHRIVGPDNAEQLTGGSCVHRCCSRNQCESAGALPIKSKVFGARRCHQHFRYRTGQMPQARRIRIQALAKALIGHITKGNRPLR